MSKELEEILSQKREIQERIAVLKGSGLPPAPAPQKGVDSNELAEREIKARLDHHLTDQRLLLDHIAFLQVKRVFSLFTDPSFSGFFDSEFHVGAFTDPDGNG